MVQFQGQDFDSPQVIGFKSNPKPCGLTISLTRGDGTVVDGSMPSFWLDVYNSTGTWVATTKTYAPGTQGHWKIEFVDPADGEDPDGYWIGYGCEYGMYDDGSQYPARYKAADKRQAADRVQAKGHYVDVIPYWRVATTYNQTVVAGITYFYDPDFLERVTTVYSSVPFRVTYGVYKREGYQRHGYYGPMPFDTHAMDCPNRNLGGTYILGSTDDPVQVLCQDGGLAVTLGESGPGTGESTTTAVVDYAANVSGEPLTMDVLNTTPGGTTYEVECAPDCSVGGYMLPIAGAQISVYIIGITPVYDY